MNRRHRSTSIIFLLAALAAGQTACNTMHGIGRDTEKAGKKIQKEADRQSADTTHAVGPRVTGRAE